jgi:hypothetical protein
MTLLTPAMRAACDKYGDGIPIDFTLDLFGADHLSGKSSAQAILWSKLFLRSPRGPEESKDTCYRGTKSFG